MHAPRWRRADPRRLIGAVRRSWREFAADLWSAPARGRATNAPSSFAHEDHRPPQVEADATNEATRAGRAAVRIDCRERVRLPSQQHSRR